MSQKYSQDEAQALVKALKEGNQLAFSIVYKMYAAQTFSLAFKKGHSLNIIKLAN